MENLNSHLQLPPQLQAVLNSIDEMPLCLAELQITDHPKLPQFDRFVRVYDIDAKSRQEYVYFVYEQVLKDKTTGEEINIKLPTPEWIVLKDTWSYFRNEQDQTITLPLVEGSEVTETKVRVPSYKYMIWLMKNNKAGLLQLIQGYLVSFVAAKESELDAL